MTLCDNCGSGNHHQFAKKNGLQYLECLDCGFVFTDVTSFDFVSFNEESIGELKELHISKATSPRHLKNYNKLLAEFESYRQTGNFLEVGCATGSFLSVAKARGWNCTGVEPVSESAQYGIDNFGLNIHIGVLETAKLQPESFDVVFSNAVLEHVPSPRTMVKHMFSLLRPGGILYADTVNLDSYTWKFLGDRWKLFDPKMHLSLFTPKTLSNLCASEGFEIKKITTHGVRFHASRKEQPRGFGRVLDELRKAPYSFAARRNGKGDNIAVYAIRPA
jgi:2-polyprenyl-3-methyl-5-hydroxy-6-metoxy-1,4-benzoquinol methylase